MLEETLTFIRRNIRTATIVDKNGNRTDRMEYPVLAVREIVLNALIHRDYSIHTDHSPVRVILYRDRLEVENPGGLYGRITVDELERWPLIPEIPLLQVHWRLCWERKIVFPVSRLSCMK